jgi:hypothetical protein
MSTLYIANPTAQAVLFSYRVPEQANFPLRQHMIRPGMQIALPENFSTPQIEGVLRQHVKYGITPIEEVERVGAFIPLVYSVDKKILPSKLAAAMLRNVAVLRERGRQFRQEAAVAEAVRIEASLRDQGIPGSLHALEVAAMEDPKDAIGEFTEGTRVTRADLPPDGRPIVSLASKAPRRKAA